MKSIIGDTKLIADECGGMLIFKYKPLKVKVNHCRRVNPEKAASLADSYKRYCIECMLPLK